ncbi:Mpv17/PMP22 family protein [Candidatus Woesearchaeota archaeon]|nr:Mpv17/PMP22 family protein [Candidatus Woesearchaeota archaeon]
MAEPSELENMAQAAPQTASQPAQQQPEKKKEETPLEEIANGAKNVAAFGVGTALPFVWPFGTGINNAVTALPLAMGSAIEDKMQGKPINWVKGAKESLVGTIINRPLERMFGYINISRDYVTANYGMIPGFAAATAALGAAQAVFVGAYMGLNHVIQNHTFKGLYEKLKKDYLPTIKRTWKYVLPFSALNVTLLPLTGLYQTLGVTAQLAYGSLMSLLFRLVGPKAEGTSLKNLVKELNPFAYIGGTISVTAKAAKNTIGGLYTGLYDLGRAIGGYSAKAAPATAPALQPA